MNRLKLGYIAFRYTYNSLQDDFRTEVIKWYELVNVSLWYAVKVLRGYDYIDYDELVDKKRLHETIYKEIRERKENVLTFTDIEQGEKDFALIYDTLKERMTERRGTQ